MKTFKKALAVVLCVVITLTAAPLGGLVGLELPSLFDFEAKAASYSGSCGDNVYWSLDTSTGVLKITGTGSMKDYSYSADVPWSSYRSNIKTVNIGSSVTSISYAAFYYCMSLTSVTIGNSVTSIVDYSFYDCTSLTSITIPDSVTSIGKYAFSGCTALKDVYYSGDISSWLNISFSSTSSNPLCNGAKLYFDGELVTDIVIPDGTESIKNSAFCGCTSLASVTIPNSVTSIGNTAFDGCTNLASVIIPDSVTSIGNYAFYNCKALAELTMPISAKIYNSSYTFYNCANIDKVTFTKGTGVSSSYDATTSGSGTYYQYTPWYVGNSKTIVFEKGITSISANMFKGYSTVRNVCFTGTQAEWNEITIGEENTGITTVDIYYEVVDVATSGDYKYGVKADGTAVIISYSGADVTVAIPAEIDGYKISGLYPGAFALNTSITGFTVDSTNEYLSSDENGILYNKNKTQIIAYPAGKTETSITIPRTIKGFAKSAFSGSTKLTDVYYEGTLAEWCAIDFGNAESNPLSDANNLYIDGNVVVLLSIPESIETIGNYAFYSCESLATITLADGVKTIGGGAFGNCTAAITVNLGSGIEKIGESAFFGCTGIKDVYYPGSIAQFADIEIASGNTELTGATIHTEYNSDGKPTASGKCGDNLYWSYYEDGRLVISGKGAMNNYTSSSNAPWYSYRTSIKSVELSSGKISIDDYAFYNCSAIENVYYTGDIAGWCEISFGGSYANPMCYADNLYIGGKLIEGELIIPDSVTSIGSYAFYGRTGLASITIPDSVINIGSSAFSGCTGLTSVTIGNGVTSIGNYAFYNCTGLKELTMPVSVKICNSENTFYNCKNIEKITLTKGSGTAQNYGTSTSSNATDTYYGYTPWYISGCKNVIIEDGVTSIGSYAFDGCTSITNVYYTGDIAGWCAISFGGSYANPMCYADNLYIGGKLIEGELIIPDSVTSIGNYAFYGCSGLTSVTIPDSVKSIGTYAFYACTSLTIVTIPDGVTSIGDYTFFDCTSLTSVTIPDSVTRIGDYAFYNCTSLKELTMPVSAKIYNSKYTFGGCKNIEKVTLTKGDGTVQSYGTSTSWYETETYYGYTPWYKSGCSTVIIEDGVTSIGSYAFSDCTGLTSVTIGDSVTSIGYSAFYNCTSLKELTMPVSAKIYNSQNTFGGCKNIEKVTLTKGNGTAQNYGSSSSSSAYYGYTPWYISECSTVFIEDGVTRIGGYTFYKCTSLKKITIGKDVKTIGSYAFNSSGLTSVYYNGSEAEWNTITVNSYNAPLINAIKYFNHTHSFKEVVDIPSTCIEQGRNIIACECGLTNGYVDAPLADHTSGAWETVTPAGCETEGKMVQKCTVCSVELDSSVIPATGHTPGTWETAIPAGCESEGKMVQKCTACSKELLSTSIPATGHTDGEWKITTNPTTTAEGVKTLYCATCNEPLKTATVPMLDPVCDYLEWEVNEDKTVTITDCDTSYSGEFSIPAAIYEYPVTGIGSSAFYNCDNITKITIPATVTSIKDESYYYVGFHTCDNLESIVVDEANGNYSSENGVLYNKDKTKLISVPAKAIDGEFVMPSTVATVSRYAFDAHNGIKLTLSDNLNSIDWSYINAKEFIASDSCANFTTVDGVVFSKDKTTLYRFPVASDITEYDIPVGVFTIGRYAFYKSSLKQVTISYMVSSIASMAFYDCEQLERVDYHCLNCWCEYIKFEENTANPLANGTALYIDDTLVDDLDVINEQNDDLHEEGLHDGTVELIGAYAFYGYEHFRSLTIPSTVWKIGREAFFGCDNLKLLTVLGNVTEWGTGVFRSCPDLYTVQFAEGTTKIGAEAFWSCDNLQELYIPSTMTYIGNGAFYGHSGQGFNTLCYGGNQWNKLHMGQYGTSNNNNYRFDYSTVGYHKHTTSSSTRLFNALSPTCTENGYTGDTRNASCLMYTSLGEVVPATGHTAGEWETTVEPGCVSEGTKVKKCTVCKEEVETDTIPVTGHDYKAVVTEPTCTEGGYTTNTCSKCSNFYRSDETEAIGHKTGEWETKVEPGCVSEGTKVKKCTVCKEEVETDTIPVTGHDYKAVVTKPTCTVDGYTTHTCSVCKDTYTDSVVKAEGHKYDSVVTPNTCTKDGYTTHTCSVCDDTYTDSETKATGHSHKSKVTKEPTCTNTGIRTFTCHCGDSYTEVIKANGHTKGEWEYIGGKEYAKSCIVCGDKLESKIVTVDMFFNGENVNKKQVLNKSTATVTATVTDNFVNDLVFASSDSSTVSVDANGNIVANNIGKATITVTIKDTAISDSIEVEVLPRDFTVTWNVNGKQTKQTVKEEAKFTPNVNTTLKGYKFIGWDKTVPTTMPAENLTFTAQYELIVKQLKIKNPSTSTINYGETLVMHADFSGVELPEGWKIQWTVEGTGFNMAPAADGLTCKMTSVANGNATVKATLVDENGEAVLDANGNEMSDSKQLTSKAGFWQKFVSFFKNLFGISRIILQSI